ncbi:hypothetical protein BGZ80_010311 [Entomortierella chlamydospora]|uniref:Uncharacterized protein n=1 Tax=Entomortierella chlamydospora TaxID=101097 RepID=A0A9P6T035_9FUNG|nr:hypothetical protein BGZ79_004739 [Entomortierella chlamydospora]KAG0014679.1 hypothetical protein BGZ80_010311 [Entomortierella chlamydospora]
MSNKRRKLDPPIEHLIKFFEDPPNAQELMSTWNAQSTASSSDNRPVQPPNKKAFRGLQLEFGGGYPEIKDTNNVKVFIATLYLKRKLSELIQGRPKLDRNALKKNSKVFTDMANELSQREPQLRGVTSIALFSHYTRILEYCRHSEEKSASQEDPPQWTRTLFYKISSELLTVDARILNGNQGQDEINDEAQETSDEPGLPRSSNSRNGESPPTQPAQRAYSPLHSPIPSPSSSSSNGGLPTRPSDTSPPPSRHSIEPVDGIQYPSPGPEDRSREDTPIYFSETDRMHARQDALAGQECPLDDFVRALCDQDKITRSNIEDLQKETKDLRKEVKDLQKENKDLHKKVDTLTETMKALEEMVHDLRETVEARPAGRMPFW